MSPDAAAPARRIDANTERAARTFLRRLDGKYAVVDALLYGSRARGDHKPDSDADIAIILKGERGDRYEVVRDLGGIEFDVMLRNRNLHSGRASLGRRIQRADAVQQPRLDRQH